MERSAPLGLARLQVKFPDGKIVTSMYARQRSRKDVGTIARCGYRLGLEGRGWRVDGSRGLVNILICSFGVTLLISKGLSFLKQVFLALVAKCHRGQLGNLHGSLSQWVAGRG